PRVLSVLPAEGPAAGGTPATVKFADIEGAGALEVLFDGAAAQVVRASAGEASVLTPPHTRGAVEVRVRRETAQAALPGGFFYREPRVVSLSPGRGPTGGGAAVSVKVEDFGVLGQSVQVRFGAALAAVVGTAGDQIEVRTPAGTGPGAVDVSVAAGALEAVLRGGYSYEGEVSLAVSGVEPASGTICGGEKVVIRGTGFGAGLRVRFGSVLARSVRVLGPGEAEATTPAVPEDVREVAVGVSLNGADYVQGQAGFSFRDERPEFIRGDADHDGERKVTDAVVIADLITGARSSVPNEDAADANDDGRIDTGDLVAITGFLFQGIGPLPPPGPSPGRDPTPDLLKGCRPAAPPP
ncbi:MAG: IPT/TIG domain-containing protein, partial [Thermoanaerobaculia bacterium]